MIIIRKWHFFILAGTMLVLAVAGGCGRRKNISTGETAKEEKAVLYLDDEPVSAEEYAMLTQEYCNQIYMQYTTDQVNSEDFWETEIDGTTPCEMLEDIIEDELRGNYARKDLAVELGITQDFTYAELMESMDTENDTRENLSENGVSYGLSSYDEASYYKYWYSNLETQVVSALIQDEIDISQKDCETYYNENQEEFTYDVGVDLWYAEIPYGEDIQQKEAQEKAAYLCKAMENAESVDELETVFDDVDIEQLNLNSLDTQEGMSGIYSQRWALASQMDEGEVYGPYEENGAWCVIKCIQRTENGSLDLDTVQPRIERYLQTQEAQKLIEEKADELKIKSGGIAAKEVILETLY